MNSNCYNTFCPFRSNETSNPTYCACCACPNRENQDYIVITTDHTIPLEGHRMSDYIEREAVLAYPIRKDHYDRKHGNEHFIFGIESVIEFVENLPAADVAPVVRCKECRYYQNAKVNKKGFLSCPASGMEITEDDYCSYGERREDNT